MPMLDQALAEITSDRADPDADFSLPGWIYTDREFFDLEMERIIRPSWQIVCHVNEIANPGDYQTIDYLGESVVVIRGEDRQVRAFTNVCRHRAMRLIEGPSGCARKLVCPYHAWTFESDGRLSGVPMKSEYPALRLEENGLVPVAHEVWHGFVFVNLSGTAPPLEELYGVMGAQLAPWRMDRLQMVAELSWECAFNWKILVENFAECYHHIGAHVKIFEPLFPGKTCWSEDEHPGYTVAHLPLIVAGLTLDTWDGDAWIGLVPFQMAGVRPWWSPSVVDSGRRFVR